MNPETFLNTRAVGVRHRDGATFYGWVVNASEQSVTIDFRDALSLQPTDFYEFTLVCGTGTAIFESSARALSGTAIEVEIPSRLQVENTRKADRLPLSGVIGEVVLEGQPYPAMVQDLSPGGAGVVWSRQCSPGTWLEFKLGNDHCSIQVPADVCHCHPFGSSGKLFKLGLKFHAVDAPVQQLIDSLSAPIQKLAS